MKKYFLTVAAAVFLAAPVMAADIGSDTRNDSATNPAVIPGTDYDMKASSGTDVSDSYDTLNSTATKKTNKKSKKSNGRSVDTDRPDWNDKDK